MGQDQSKLEKERSLHRRTQSTAIMPTDAANYQTHYPDRPLFYQNLSYTPKLPRLDELKLQDNFNSSELSIDSEVTLNSQYNEFEDRLEVKLSSSAPPTSSLAPNLTNKEKSNKLGLVNLPTLKFHFPFRNHYKSNSNSIGVEENYKEPSPIITISSKPSPNLDPILTKLSNLPRIPKSFGYEPIQPSTPLSAYSPINANTFPFPSLFSRNSSTNFDLNSGDIKPIFPVPKLDELEDSLFDLMSDIHIKALDQTRIVVSDQEGLTIGLRDMALGLGDLHVGANNNLNPLKDDFINLEIAVNDLQIEMEQLRLRLRQSFKTIEKINTLLPKQDRLGYLNSTASLNYPNLNSSYRLAMLQGKPPQFQSGTQPSGSTILNRKRRESKVVVTLDSVLDIRHRSLSQLDHLITSPSPSILHYDYFDFNRSISSQSNYSFDNSSNSHNNNNNSYHSSATELLQDMLHYQNKRIHTPTTIRNRSPTLNIMRFNPITTITNHVPPTP